MEDSMTQRMKLEEGAYTAIRITRTWDRLKTATVVICVLLFLGLSFLFMPYVVKEDSYGAFLIMSALLLTAFGVSISVILNYTKGLELRSHAYECAIDYDEQLGEEFIRVLAVVVDGHISVLTAEKRQ